MKYIVYNDKQSNMVALKRAYLLRKKTFESNANHLKIEHVEFSRYTGR